MHKMGIRNTKKLQAFQYRLLGMSYQAIASNTGWSEFTLRRYFSPKGKWYDEYQKWSVQELKLVQKQARNTLIKQTDNAVKVLVHSLSLINTKPGIAIRAANEILNRSGLTPNSVPGNNNKPTDVAEAMIKALEESKKK